MPDPDLTHSSPDFRLKALSRWDNEGGAIAAAAREAHLDVPDMTNAELVLLRVRVIALENVLIAVLAEGSDRQRQTARDMADVIAPRTGSAQHTLTIWAAQHMTDLVDLCGPRSGGAAVAGRSSGRGCEGSRRDLRRKTPLLFSLPHRRTGCAALLGSAVSLHLVPHRPT